LTIYLDIPPGIGYELRYCIEEYNDQSGECRSYWDRKEVCNFIGAGDRQKVLALLLALVRHLISLASPACVKMYVEDSGNGPQHKDVLITEVFKSCGYALHTCDPYYGRRVFRMKRPEGDAS
jgi:hypothetical protein